MARGAPFYDTRSSSLGRERCCGCQRRSVDVLIPTLQEKPFAAERISIGQLRLCQGVPNAVYFLSNPTVFGDLKPWAPKGACGFRIPFCLDEISPKRVARRRTIPTPGTLQLVVGS